MLNYNDCDDDHYEDSSNGGIGTCLAKDQAINHSCHRYNILYACGTRHRDSSIDIFPVQSSRTVTRAGLVCFLSSC